MEFCGLRVTRRKLRQAIHSVDPLGTMLWWGTPIIRRPYSVKGPNALWHLDSNHKLIRWPLVMHGIDGCSRLIVYLRCSSDNKCTTVYELFERAVHAYSVPSRERTDHGLENV